VKQVRLVGGNMPSFTAALVGEEGQPTGEVGPIAIVTEVNPNALSSILAKRKWDDGAGSSGRKKSKAPMSLCALRQVAGLTPSAGHPSIVLDVPPTPSTIEAPVATPALSPPPFVVA